MQAQFHVQIVPEVLAKIMHWVSLADRQEVSGFGKVCVQGPLPQVIEACLVEQTNTQGSTDMSGQGLSKAMYQLKDTAGSLQYWWHSHGHGEAYFSKTDLDTIQDLGEHGWLLSSVFNVRGQVQTSFYQRGPFPLYLDGIDLVQALPALSQAACKMLETEYQNKVRSRAFSGREKRKWNRWEKRHRTVADDWDSWDEAVWVPGRTQ